MNYKAISEDFNNFLFKNLDFSDDEIIILFKPGHYDGLFQNIPEIKFLKSQGAEYLKNFEHLVKLISMSKS